MTVCPECLRIVDAAGFVDANGRTWHRACARSALAACETPDDVHPCELSPRGGDGSASCALRLSHGGLHVTSDGMTFTHGSRR